ncbi:MAG: hypothetical protein PVF94_09105 [Desulfobacterales bacterium]|jgi:hypothetical protein
MKAMRNYLYWGLGTLFLLVLITSCGFNPPVGNPQSGYSVFGFVGKTVEIPAPHENVLLLNGNTRQPIDMERTNFLGHYKFLGLPPGFYIVQVSDKELKVLIKNENVRQDINLSAADGKMDYFGHYLKQGVSSGGSAGSRGTKDLVTRDASGWPPPYQRPPGRSTWEDSSPEKLLYKFAGRWDSATSNTLHNIYLKPDGSFEDSYEAGYSGQFVDQGGFQTGNWGAAGNEQAGGRWTIQGTLRQGTITLIHRNGKRTNYRYQVHCRGSECYGSEYFFNGKLYSVKYIYR